MATPTDTVYTGSVQTYDDRRGYGFIEPDPDQGLAGLLLVHRASLRSRDLQLHPGQRVSFSTQSVPTGLLATDVRPADADASAQGDSERMVGTVRTVMSERGFGFIRLDNGSDAFFHVSRLSDPQSLPVAGALASFRLESTPRGLQAVDIELEQAAPAPATEPTQDYLARAILARDARKYDEAAALYEKGLLQTPSVQLVLSYAAMEKNRHRRTSAMRVYEEGIRRFPTIAKLREDAGILAASLKDHDRALRLLREALNLCEQFGQGGTKGVLVALARTSYQVDTHHSLQQSISYYERALAHFGRGHTHLPDSDLLSLNIAKIRIQHHRGNLTFQFLRSVGFTVVRARLLDQVTEGAEIIVEVNAADLRESYGLSRYLILRCMFKTDVTRADLDALDAAVRQWSDSGLGDEQVALVVVASLPDDLQRLLAKRIEEQKKSLPAIVPIQQADMERAEDAASALRAVLDRWLYRRDLFTGSAPVVGRRFFGRDKPLAELREAIASSAPIGVFGLRKVGKTSLLKETQRRASEWGDVVVYVDLLRVPSDVSDCRWLYWRLATDLRREANRLPTKIERWRLGGQFEDFLDIPPDFPVATAFDADLTRLLEAIRTTSVNPRPKVVFLLDEIERLLPTGLGKAGFTGFFDFFSYLRGVSQEYDEFLLIVTGANALITEAPQFDGRDNPVFNYFSEVYLQLLEPQECSLMVRELGRGMGITFSPDALDGIYALTGGHPFFARQLCSFVARQFPDRPLRVERPTVEGLTDQYIDFRSGDFQEIMERLARDFPSEFDVCVELARRGGRIPLAALRQIPASGSGSAIRHLLGYQIVSIDEPDAVLTVDLLRRWLRDRYVDAKA